MEDKIRRFFNKKSDLVFPKEKLNLHKSSLCPQEGHEGD